MRIIQKFSLKVTILSAIAVISMLGSQTVAEPMQTPLSKIGPTLVTITNADGTTNQAFIFINSVEALCTNKIQASMYFKTNSHSRTKSALVLKPYIKRGMNTNELLDLLGKPSGIIQIEGKPCWAYTTGFSQSLNVTLDTNNLVDVIEP